VYDIHNHVLPHVDDGAPNLEVALRMLRIAASQGITHVACTPHANERDGEDSGRLFQSAFDELKEAATSADIAVHLALASELMLGADILRTLTRPFGTYHGAGRYCLLEFPTETPFEIILNVVRSVRRMGIWCVIPHFERFSRAQRRPDQPHALRAEGAVLTLDAGSLVGQFGPVITRRARQLLRWNAVDLLASDAHDDAGHGFYLEAGQDAAAQIVGDQVARRFVLENPKKVWDGVPWREETEAARTSEG